ncbi:MAG: DUF58 domain-containing protein [Prosthecochloris sp.]|nr:DUF58 domain-containing protein [Prosthecochloris sp.]
MQDRPDDMIDIARLVRRLEIRSRRLTSEQLCGEYRSVFKGRGIEFSHVREYEWGDDVRAIDWNTSARRNRLHVKQFAEERERVLFLAVDCSASMMYGSRQRLKRELAAEAAALLGFSALMNNDRVGLVMFSDRVEAVIPPRRGRTHLLRLMETILRFRPAGRRTSIDAACSFILRVCRRRAIVFLLSDLEDDGCEQAMRAVNARHDFVVLHLSDPLERRLPLSGILHVRDPESGTVQLIDAGSRAACERYRVWKLQGRRQLERKLRSMRVDSVFLETDGPVAGPLNRFFRLREQRRL